MIKQYKHIHRYERDVSVTAFIDALKGRIVSVTPLSFKKISGGMIASLTLVIVEVEEK